jgi:hypothetical protein
MANAFAVYRSILLSDMSRLLDEKLAPVSQRLTRLENHITHLQRATHHLSGAFAQNMASREDRERREVKVVSSEESNESKGDHPERGKDEVEEDDDDLVVEVVTLKESPAQERNEDEEESLKCEMKHLLSLLRSNPGQQEKQEKQVDSQQGEQVLESELVERGTEEEEGGR